MERWSESDGWRLTERGVRLCESVSESGGKLIESLLESAGDRGESLSESERSVAQVIGSTTMGFSRDSRS